MNFDWSAYLSLARHLISPADVQPSEEARLRCAISRAYYAAHCQARNYLRDRDNVTFPLHGAAHEYVIDEFRLSKDRARRQIGAYLQTLKNNRVTADYYDDAGSLGAADGDKRKKAQQCIVLATTVIQALASLPPRSFP